LLAGLCAGALIGYERSYHGRPAGFRTHSLVCMASSLLMLVTVYEAHWVRVASDSVRLDPTRMAQGIMTGIGFLGAGAIIKEGLTIRGLTTAASIWITAAIGVLAGIGFYFPLVVSVVLTLGVLSVFRWIEDADARGIVLPFRRAVCTVERDDRSGGASTRRAPRVLAREPELPARGRGPRTTQYRWC
jgi:putative Mg2+ transporter-C (MgtC) family protein